MFYALLSILHSQDFTNPIHLDRANTSCITPVRKHVLVVHDGFDLATEKHAGRMDCDRLISHDRAVASIGEETGGIGRKASEEALQDRNMVVFVGRAVGDGGIGVRIEELGLFALGDELLSDVLQFEGFVR